MAGGLEAIKASPAVYVPRETTIDDTDDNKVNL